MNNTKANPNCTCNATRVDYVCTCKAGAELCDPAELIEIIAGLTLEGQSIGDGTTEQLRTALDRLIDERVENRMAEKVGAKPAPAKTRGQEIAEALVAGHGVNIVMVNDGGLTGFCVTQGTEEWARRGIKLNIAAAIDRAIADRDLEWARAMRDECCVPANPRNAVAALAAIKAKAAAEEREVCAVAAMESVPRIPGYVLPSNVAAAIRNRK